MRTILITGASRGIGRAIAERFGKEEGARLVLNSLHGGEKLQSLSEELEKNGCRVLTCTGDVSDPVFVKYMVGEAEKTFGHIDVLVNNAGISMVGLIQDMSADDWNRILGVNLSAVHYCSQAVIPGMLKAGTGRIINISSVWGNIGASCEAAYSATKGGVNSYTKALGKELAPSHISVNALACGAIDTDMNRCFSEEDLAALSEEIPFGRLGEPSEAAEAVYALSQMPLYLTGQIVTMDGGWC